MLPTASLSPSSLPAVTWLRPRQLIKVPLPVSGWFFIWLCVLWAKPPYAGVSISRQSRDGVVQDPYITAAKAAEENQYSSQFWSYITLRNAAYLSPSALLDLGKWIRINEVPLSPPTLSFTTLHTDWLRWCSMPPAWYEMHFFSESHTVCNVILSKFFFFSVFQQVECRIRSLILVLYLTLPVLFSNPSNPPKKTKQTKQMRFSKILF